MCFGMECIHQRASRRYILRHCTTHVRGLVACRRILIQKERSHLLVVSFHQSIGLSDDESMFRAGQMSVPQANCNLVGEKPAYHSSDALTCEPIRETANSELPVACTSRSSFTKSLRLSSSVR